VTDSAGLSDDSGVEARVAEVVRPAIRELAAYHVPPAQDVVKLDAMENPYRLPVELREQWLDALRDADLNRYPDASATVLKERLREVFDVPPGAGMLLGNGSDEIIQILEAATGGPVLAPEPTFVMYDMIARFLNVEFVGVPLKEGFGLDLEAMLAAIDRHRPKVVFLAYPNNPTGNLFDEQAMERIISAAPGLVVIDEAYHAFADRTLMPQVLEYPNVLVMRTLSKLGLAGLRLGFAVAHPAWIEQLDKLRLPYNVGVLTQKSVEFALSRLDVFLDQAARIKAERARVHEALRDAGWDCYASDANFILFRGAGRDSDEIFQSLLDLGVLVKNLSRAHPALTGCLRVTIGTPDENDRFLEALGR